MLIINSLYVLSIQVRNVLHFPGSSAPCKDNLNNYSQVLEWLKVRSHFKVNCTLGSRLFYLVASAELTVSLPHEYKTHWVRIIIRMALNILHVRRSFIKKKKDKI